MPFLEFSRRKNNPQEQIQKELERAQKSHDKFKELDLQLYKEITVFIEQNLAEIELILSKYSAGESDWRHALVHSDTVIELKKLLKRAKILSKEDKQSSILELNSISLKIKYLDLLSVSNNDLNLGMTRNFGMRDPLGYERSITTF